MTRILVNLATPRLRSPKHAPTGRNDQARAVKRAGVREYWVVDPEIDVVRVYRRVEEAFERPVELRREAGDRLTTVLMPGLEMALDGLFSS